MIIGRVQSSLDNFENLKPRWIMKYFYFHLKGYVEKYCKIIRRESTLKSIRRENNVKTIRRESNVKSIRNLISSF